MESIAHFFEQTATLAWGMWLVVVAIGGGLFFTIRFKLVQVRRLGHAFNVIRGKYDDPDDPGAINHFQALSAALSATIGLGNIAGVAVAIQTGGPGALVWMWIVACVGMATKFTSCTLSTRYRLYHEDGTPKGGPMWFIEIGLGKAWRPMAYFFSACCVIGCMGGGNMFQSNQVAATMARHYHIPGEVTGAVLVILVGLVIIGGIKRIGRVAGAIVPFMCVIYVLAALVIVLKHVGELPQIFGLIFSDAFSGHAAAGGLVGEVIRQGLRRGVFSNEAGLGSAAIAHAAAKTDEPVREGLVAMIGPLVDTLIICTMTAIVIISTGAWSISADQAQGANLTILAFDEVFAWGEVGFGGVFIPFAILLFAFSTMISWSYYGEQCAEYLFGERAILPFKIVYLSFMLLGTFQFKFDTIINFSDTFFALMLVPNMIACLLLSGKVKEMMDDYFQRMAAEEGASTS